MDSFLNVNFSGDVSVNGILLNVSKYVGLFSVLFTWPGIWTNFKWIMEWIEWFSWIVQKVWSNCINEFCKWTISLNCLSLCKKRVVLVYVYLRTIFRINYSLFVKTKTEIEFSFAVYIGAAWIFIEHMGPSRVVCSPKTLDANFPKTGEVFRDFTRRQFLFRPWIGGPRIPGLLLLRPMAV